MDEGQQTRVEMEVADSDLLSPLTGGPDSILRNLERSLGVRIGGRGSVIQLAGPVEQVAIAQRILHDLLSALRERDLPQHELEQRLRVALGQREVRLRELDEVVIRTSGKKSISPKGPAQKAYIEQMRSHEVVFGVGPAGTGKTYLAMAMAVQALLERKVQRIVLTRPAVEAGEKLGFLPGDLAEKVNPYLRPLYDALHDMMETEKAAGLIEKGVIEVAPLAFMRGRTLSDSFVILDEAQNTTTEQMKMFLTRLGFRSRMVVTGDASQVDLPRGTRSGLGDVVGLLRDVPGIAMTFFSDVDVVRHPLVQRIVRAYDQRDAEREGLRHDSSSAFGGKETR